MMDNNTNIEIIEDKTLELEFIVHGNPQEAPRFPLLTNLNHFYPVAEMRQGNKLPPHKSRSTGFGSEQPEFVAWQTATLKICTTKRKG